MPSNICSASNLDIYFRLGNTQKHINQAIMAYILNGRHRDLIKKYLIFETCAEYVFYVCDFWTIQYIGFTWLFQDS